jgi:kumamolisin
MRATEITRAILTRRTAIMTKGPRKMTSRKMFPGSVVSIPATTGMAVQGLIVNSAQPKHRKETMQLHFSLAIPETALRELEARVERGEVVKMDEQRAKYSADPSLTRSLVDWLTKEGFQIAHQTDDATSVYATATASQVEASLGVHMVRVTSRGQTYTAASDVPSLPADVGANVIHIGGLQPFVQAHKHFRVNSQRLMAFDSQDSASNVPPYKVASILSAYNADELGLTGEGQEIGILIDTVPLPADLNEFWQLNNIPPDMGRIEEVRVNGDNLPPQEGEESLDTEWSSGVAPGAKIVIYATGTLQLPDIDRALDKIISDVATRPGLRQVSISLGLGETYVRQIPGEIMTQHQKYLRLAAAGVNIFVSSGDAGSNPDQSGHASDGPLQPEYAASDPCVVGVGGTSLMLSTNGTVSSEAGWAGSGGGKSAVFSRPAWQAGLGVDGSLQRSVPDVSLAADPSEGALLVLNGRTMQIGGTSWSAPVWAAFCALINEARERNGKPPLGFLNPLLYPLLGTNCFRDIVVGSNGHWNAGTGYDLVTGIGVPDMKQLVAKLS